MASLTTLQIGFRRDMFVPNLAMAVTVRAVVSTFVCPLTSTVRWSDPSRSNEVM